jgi:hypothetical protein
MRNKCNNRQLRWMLAAILLLSLGSASLYAQSIQAVAGTLDVIAEPNSGGESGGITTGQILVPFVSSDGSTVTTVWFSPGDGSGGYVNCAILGSGCTLNVITSITNVLTYLGAGGDSSSGAFWNAPSVAVSCMEGGGTVTKTTFQHRLTKGILTVRGTATVSGSILNYPSDPILGCDTTNLIATYTISGTANYTAQFTLDTQSGTGDYLFQWMHISFNK